MGWWKADDEGNSLVPGGPLTWGDQAADVIDNALDEIDKAFLHAWDRKPSNEELKAGLLFSLRVRT